MPGSVHARGGLSELIEPLTRWVVDEALRQQRVWLDAGLDLTMAVNVSARTSLVAALSRIPSPRSPTGGASLPGKLILELTERVLIDGDAAQVLDALHTTGQRVAIDDFGTGHSSLVHLQRMNIDEIKIDRSFVMKLNSVANDAVIVRSTIDLAHNLGLTVVAEGVENEAALEILLDHRCDSAARVPVQPPPSSRGAHQLAGRITLRTTNLGYPPSRPDDTLRGRRAPLGQTSAASRHDPNATPAYNDTSLSPPPIRHGLEHRDLWRCVRWRIGRRLPLGLICRKAGRLRCTTFSVAYGDDLRPNFIHLRRGLG